MPNVVSHPDSRSTLKDINRLRRLMLAEVMKQTKAEKLDLKTLCTCVMSLAQLARMEMEYEYRQRQINNESHTIPFQGISFNDDGEEEEG